MKKIIETYIQDLQKELMIPIKQSISESSFTQKENKTVYVNITVGNFGVMLYDTWQPISDTDFLISVDYEGNAFYSKYVYNNGDHFYKKVILGNYKSVILEEIKKAIKHCIAWSLDDGEKYKEALNKMV